MTQYRANAKGIRDFESVYLSMNGEIEVEMKGEGVGKEPDDEWRTKWDWSSNRVKVDISYF